MPGNADVGLLGLLLALLTLWSPDARAAKAARERSGGGNPDRVASDAEVQLSAEDFKLLDAPEAEALSRGDKAFGLRDFKRAAAEYESFMVEFGKSRAVPYALLRKGRALELNNKRNEALRTYREVVDYFPNETRYAAPALFYTGQAHAENGDLDRALKSWADLAADPGYRKHPLAATALVRTADELMKRNQRDQALAFYEQVATDFRTANPGAAQHGIARLAAYCVGSLNEPRLRAFYEKVKTFEPQPDKPGANVAEDRLYWDAVRGLVKQGGRFEAGQDGAKAHEYFRYWAGQLGGKFPSADDVQLDWIAWARHADGDTLKWTQRMDQQFERNYKPGDYGRIMQWMNYFAHDKSKVREYYGKLDFAKLGNGAIESVMKFFYDQLSDADLGRNLFQKLRMNEYDDAGKARLAQYFFTRDAGIVKDLCAAIQEKDLAKFTMLEFHLGRKEYEAALALANELLNSPKFAKDALRRKAAIFEALKQFDKAIPVYRQIDEPPGTLYAISHCYASLGKIDEAITQLKEIENFFKDQSSKAAYRIAQLLKHAGDHKRHVAQLRYIMKAYPRSGESSTAHQELEKMGVKIGGGVDAEP